MKNETPAVPLMPDYDARHVPMPQRAPEPEARAQAIRAEQPDTQAEPQPDASQQKPAKLKRKPQSRRQKQKRTIGPETERETLLSEISELRKRRDSHVLDLQLRVGTLRDFLKSHDLWEPFLSQNAWW